MNNPSKVTLLLSKIIKNFRKEFIYIIILCLLIAFLEILGMSLFFSVIPYLFNEGNTLFNLETLIGKTYFLKDIYISELSEKNTLILILFSVLIIIYIFKNILVFGLSFMRIKIFTNINQLITTNLYTSYIFKNLAYHNSVNKSYLIHNISSTSRAVKAINSIANIFTEITLFCGIFLLLMFQNPFITSFIFLIILFTSFLYSKISGNMLFTLGKYKEIFSAKSIKIQNETFTSIREINLFKLQNLFKSKFYNNHHLLNSVKLKEQTINLVPPLLYEILMILIVGSLFIFFLLKNLEIQNILMTLSLVSVAILKMLPSAKKIVAEKNYLNNIEYISGNFSKDIKFLIEETGKNKNVLEFKKKLDLINFNFGYNKEKKIFTNFNFKIKKGDKIAIIGKTGSGKSTLLDIISGLINFNSGKIYLDGKKIDGINKDFLDNINYLSQNSYMFDDTIAFNIALKNNLNKLEKKKILFLIRNLELNSLIGRKKNIYKKIGENGVKLSGGQKQRLGIARALFSERPILILDEITSALDDKTSFKILNFILTLKKKETILMVTHNLRLAKKFDKIVKIKGNNV